MKKKKNGIIVLLHINYVKLVQFAFISLFENSNTIWKDMSFIESFILKDKFHVRT